MSQYNDATHKSSDEPAHNYDAGAGDESEFPSTDTLWELVGDKRRRNLIRRLAHIDAAEGIRGVTIQEVSRAIAADENGGDIPDDPLVRAVTTELEWDHIPRLKNEKIVERDGDVLRPGAHLFLARVGINAFEMVADPGKAVVRRGEGDD